MDAVDVVRDQSRQRKVSTKPIRNVGIPTKKSGLAQRAIPTTIKENPSNTTVNLPAQAMIQKIRRNGSVTINQRPAKRPTNICPNDQALDCCGSGVYAVGGWSVRLQVRREAELVIRHAQRDDTALYQTGLASFLDHAKVRAGWSMLVPLALVNRLRIFVTVGDLFCH